MEKKKEIIWGSLKEYQIKDTSAEQFANNDLSRIYRKNYSFFRLNGGKLSIMLVFLSISSFRTTWILSID